MTRELDNKPASRGRPKGFNVASALDAALELFWQKGYECTTVAELCAVMKLNPPSLYCAFGNKSNLFLTALKHYENKYWTAPYAKFRDEPRIEKAVNDFFQEAAHILLSPAMPCGCMVVVAAVNISPIESAIIDAISGMRRETRDIFAIKLQEAVETRQIPQDADIDNLANALNSFLEGMSLQARSGMDLPCLLKLSRLASRLLPLSR